MSHLIRHPIVLVAALLLSGALIPGLVTEGAAAGITVSPPSGPVGTSIVVSGSGLGSSGNVSVNLGANNDSGFNHAATQIASNGTFQVSMVVSDPVVAQYCTYNPATGGSCTVYVRIT